jgi:hypothetical protein
MVLLADIPVKFNVRSLIDEANCGISFSGCNRSGVLGDSNRTNLALFVIIKGNGTSFSAVMG